MFDIVKHANTQVASNSTNPYAVDVIRAKRRDLIYRISHTEDLLDHLVTEGVITAARRSIVLTIRTRKDQNCRMLELLEARGERACRKFFYPCLMLAEPDLYQHIKTYVGGVNERVRDTRRQLIGYLLEREKEDKVKCKSRPEVVTQEDGTLLPVTETRKSTREKEDKHTASLLKPGNKQAQNKADRLMHMICTDGEVGLLEELLENCDINSVNSSCETLLHVAAEHGHLSIVELLICKGAKLDLQDNKGHTALHRAAGKGHTEIVRALIQAGAQIYSQDLEDKTAVHLAAQSEHLASVEVLVKEEAKRSESCMQDLFLHSAAREDNWRLAELLLQSGAAVNARNNHRNTPLFYAVSRNNERTAAVLLQAGAEADCDVMKEAMKLDGDSVLHLLIGEFYHQ